MEISWFTALSGWSEDSIPCPPTGTGAVTKPDRLKRSEVIYSSWSVAPGGPWITSQLPRNAEQEKRTEDQIVLCMWALHLHWKPPGHHKMGRGRKLLGGCEWQSTRRGRRLHRAARKTCCTHQKRQGTEC